MAERVSTRVPAPRATASQRRSEVIREAATLFDRAGYHTTNMSDLARSVGLEKPTLYHYFSGKDEILFWIHDEFINLLIEKAEARASMKLTAREELRLIMNDLLTLMDTHRGHVRVFFEHGRELSEKHQKTIRERRDHYQSFVQGIIERGMKNREFRRMDPRLVTFAVFGSCNWTYQWYRKGGSLESTQIADFFCDLVLHGISR